MEEKTVDVTEKVKTTVKIKPVRRSGWLPLGHDGEYKFTGCETHIVPFRSIETGQRQTGLDEAMEAKFEKALRMPAGSLSKYNEEFWSKYTVRLPKEGKTIDMDSPKDQLDLAVLKVNPLVAKSFSDIPNSPSAQFYISSELEEAKAKNATDKSERAASKKYGQLSTEDMLDMLRIYAHTEGKANARLNKNTPVDLIESTLYAKLKADPETFVAILEDVNYKTKILVDKLVTKRILIRSGSKYLVHGGDVIGNTLQTTIDFLEDPHNQNILIELKGKLDAAE